MNDRTKKFLEERQTIAIEMIEKYGGYSLIALLNMIVELEKKENINDIILKEMQDEATERNAEHKIMDFVEDLATHYWASEVVEWIKTKVELESEFDW